MRDEAGEVDAQRAGFSRLWVFATSFSWWWVRAETILGAGFSRSSRAGLQPLRKDVFLEVVVLYLPRSLVANAPSRLKPAQ